MVCVCGIECSENMDWWLARHTVTGEQGYVPSNYVVEDDNSPESQEYVLLFLVGSFQFNGFQIHF